FLAPLVVRWSLVARAWKLPERKSDGLCLSLPDDADLDFGPGRHVAHHLGELALVFDRFALEGGDDVARPDAGSRRGTVWLRVGNGGARVWLRSRPSAISGLIA